MPDLDFSVEGAEVEQFAAAPIIVFKLKIEQSDGKDSVHAVALRCQIRLQPGRRRYTSSQQLALVELFGQPDLWGNALRPMLWTHVTTMVPAFTGTTAADLPVACTYDLSLATTKFFDALGDNGEIPLCFLFSGTVFYQSQDGQLQTAPISWSKEADYRLSARVWRGLMDRYYPNSAWLCLEKETFEKLRRFKIEAGHLSWEQAIEELLHATEQKVPG